MSLNQRKLHEGENTCFWRGDTTLREQFPRLYAMSNQKEAKVADVWVTMEVGREYRFECRRRFFVFEEELLNNMMEVLHGHVWTEGVDKWVWRMVGVLRLNPLTIS